MNPAELPLVQKYTVLHPQTDITVSVNDILGKYYMAQTEKAAATHQRYKGLIEAMYKLAMAGGKRARPFLVVRTYEAYGGKDYNSICHVAAALEMLHVAMLIIDDVIDRDYVRYGVDNIAGQYRRIYGSLNHAYESVDHYANSAAILAGTLNLSEVYRMINLSDFTPEQKLITQELVTETVMQVIGGELIDTDSSIYPPDETNPLDVAKSKTAHYSFVTPMQVGAQLAGVNAKELAVLEELGNKLGIAFQLIDDVLGIFGTESLTGKSAIGDIREGKRTYMWQLTLDGASGHDKAIINKLYGDPYVTETQAHIVRQAIIESGAKDQTIKKARELASEARTIVQTLHIGQKAKEEFDEFITAMTERDF